MLLRELPVSWRASLVLLAAVACSKTAGEDITGGDTGGAGGKCAGNTDCAFGERCVDQACTTDVPPPVVDTGCDAHSDCPPGELCALASGLCVPEAATPDPVIDPPGECADSETRPCGNKVGDCEYGAQQCSGGAWGVCVGGVGPAPMESCDGKDNDCDGVVPLSELDQDQDGVRGCDGDCADSDPHVKPGAPELCDGLDNDCDGATADGVDAVCNDGDPCTILEACVGGQCQAGDNLCDCSGDLDCGPQEDGNVCNGTLVCDLEQQKCVVDAATIVSCPPATSCQSFACTPATGACVAQNLSGPCSDGNYCTVNDACQSGVCAGAGRDCSVWADRCNDGVCNEALDRCEKVAKPVCDCDDTVNADFDQANLCLDCDDTNGSVYPQVGASPGAPERCNGIDDDCDGAIDEDFDQDGDTYSVCAIDPALFDCDDANPLVNPGRLEDCGASGQGNAIDDDCDGYVDEGCAPCSAVDTDGDGVAECDGDCSPTDGSIYPGSGESCDGKDNDCNVFTTDNCGVSDACNHDGDGDPTDDPDVCRDDLLCACIVNGAGNCSGVYRCTSFCNTSNTGVVGDGCGANETCMFDLLRSANVHGCGAAPTPPGVKLGGVQCAGDGECRSNLCEKLCIGPGCNTTYCYDYCGSDAYCPAGGTVCRLDRTSANLDGRCWPAQGPFVGASAVGVACTQDSACDHGLCATDGASRYCSEACCTDADCSAGYTCSLAGDQISTSYVYPSPSGPSCTSDAQCPTGMMCYLTDGVCAWRLSETAPMCLKDVTGQGTRRAGAACSQSRECASNFCDRTLSVCVEVCCNDGACPAGLTCEMQVVQTTADRASQARVCVNLSTDEVFVRK